MTKSGGALPFTQQRTADPCIEGVVEGTPPASACRHPSVGRYQGAMLKKTLRRPLPSGGLYGVLNDRALFDRR